MPTLNPNELPRPIYGEAALAPPADPWAQPAPGQMPGPPQPPPPSKGGIPRGALFGILGVLVVAVGVVAWIGLKGDGDDGGGGSGGGGTEVTTDTSGGGGGSSTVADQATDRLIAGFFFTDAEYACVSDQFTAAGGTVAQDYVDGFGDQNQLADFVVGCFSSDSLATSWTNLVSGSGNNVTDTQAQCVYENLLNTTYDDWVTLLAASIVSDSATISSMADLLYGACFV
jgi:hypothetical protein